jgi:nucleotide-binding universal stress UspA family protein
VLNKAFHDLVVVVDTPAAASLALDAGLAATGDGVRSVTLLGVAAPPMRFAQPIPVLLDDVEKLLHKACLEEAARIPFHIAVRYQVVTDHVDRAVLKATCDGKYDLAVVARPACGRIIGFGRSRRLSRIVRRSPIPIICVPSTEDEITR